MPVIRYPQLLRQDGGRLDRRPVPARGQRRAASRWRSSAYAPTCATSALTSPSEPWAGEGPPRLAKESSCPPRRTFCRSLEGEAEFSPVLFNYQSYGRSPAVRSSRRARHSATIVDNQRDGFGAGRARDGLFFNQSGERASFTGTRLAGSSGRRRRDGSRGHEPPRRPARQHAPDQVPLQQHARAAR